MKSLKFVAAALAVAGFSAPVLAQVATQQTVNVNVTLTSKCEFTTSGGALTFTAAYESFQSGALTPTLPASIKCTRKSAVPSFTWDGGAVGTTVGVVKGLAYQLVATRGTVVDGTAPAGSALSDHGSADTAPVTIALTIPGGQAGDATGANVIRTLTVAF